MATKKVTTATTKDVTAKVTAPVTKTSEKAETTKKAETVKAVAADRLIPYFREKGIC